MAKASLRQVCFMVMPFGKKDTGVAGAAGPAQVNFDTLWRKALSPVLDKLGYTAVRADQDTGSLILLEMLERLTLADLVIADLSIPNGNVYYEVGMRHATKESGCVLIAAEWAKPLFDVAQMRRITYPLSETEVSDDQAKEICRVLESSIEQMKVSRNPPFCLEGFPNLAPERTTSFREFVLQMSKFQADVSAARIAPAADRGKRVRDVLQVYFPDGRGADPVLPGVAQELLHLVRDTLTWDETLSFIERLPESIQNLPTVREQYCLALSKTGKHEEAISAIEQLVALYGDSSERQGLIGGRYKALYQQAVSEPDKSRYLSRAIEHYERGMLLDLNDYFPSCNLPQLLKLRGDPSDAARARSIAHLVEIACERAFKRNPRDEWIKPTQLVAAFQSEDTEAASNLVTQIAREGAVGWKIESALSDLKQSTKLVQNAAVRPKLELLVNQLEALV